MLSISASVAERGRERVTKVVHRIVDINSHKMLISLHVSLCVGGSKAKAGINI